MVVPTKKDKKNNNPKVGDVSLNMAGMAIRNGGHMFIPVKKPSTSGR